MSIFLSINYEANFAAYTIAAAILVVVTQCAASGKILRIGFVVVAISAGVAQFTPGATTACIVLLFLFLGWSAVAAWRGARAARG